ncbi:MAG: inorganic phosphate transporter [Acidobacteria bacterium]|nr:inorganic phosphate transporter [Acidobacteriota bacterium]MBI3656138.1 inorganic phosphate transporter [Acidobacteriota bacterium]
MDYYVIAIIFLALAFDFSNGFHDAANSIATVVSTRVLTPLQAVSWAAFFNFIAAFTFGTAVAKTLGSGMIDLSQIDLHVLFTGLIGATAWNIITWYFGLPTSSSHALMGGYAGAAIAKAGLGVIILKGWRLTIAFIILAPVAGLVLGFALIAIVYWLFRNSNPGKVNKYFRRLQLFSAALFSLGHGTNDAQKTMGIIAGVLFTAHKLEKFTIPFWVVLICHFAIALGTMAGGWRIVHTMGSRITKLQPVGGFCAESAGGIAILVSAGFGIPVSTTHTITGAIMGVGSIRRLTAVRWGVARRILWAWILTIPLSGLLSALIFRLLQPVMPRL